ncbi:hypothetical protein [Algibacter luteus]|uniref:Uncharacterized protein n=1 Tax=Algibacter luteus TaxID=1178825 RepID=A0A1M6CAE7_9FLAO|nr:hypothetical protein [Algibacter luteus]WJJ95936.1 hypothetical protein O5O44_11960 [Algibacter luteus]SHI58002.1 hypothetical protein SAMN05216261_1158 [Algibacter luteus]
MILNTTHFNKEHKQLLSDLVGVPFSFLEAFKMKGVGSKRMIIEDVSPNLQLYMNLVSDINYANIELRKNGVLIYINKGLQNYTWAIPYYQLVIYKTNGASIHAQGRYIHFKNNKTFRENKSFFRKMLDEKIRYDEKYNFLGV